MEDKNNDIPEKRIFESISNGDLTEFKNFLGSHKGNVDFFDENGMTALQHAAYKGNKEMVQLLLDRGADVNSGKHEYNYSALHFGGLSGSSEVCRLLLEAGAKPTATNSVGRTASEMAAFVGNHHTVATINTFVPRSEIAYYSIVQGQQEEPYLPPVLVDPLHKFILCINIHPVRLALNLSHMPSLLENADKASKVLEMLCKKEMTRGSDMNETIAMKYHLYSYILREIHNAKDKQKNGNSAEGKKHDVIEIFCKKLLKPGKDGVSLDFMEGFLKECIREFPYRECMTFKNIVLSLANGHSTALAVLNSAINGQRGFGSSAPYCSTCGEEKPAKKCSKCKSVQYCDRECQRLHWFVHKKACDREASLAPVKTSPKVVDANELSAELQNLVAGQS